MGSKYNNYLIAINVRIFIMNAFNNTFIIYHKQLQFIKKNQHNILFHWFVYYVIKNLIKLTNS